MEIVGTELGRVVVVKIESGEDLLEGIDRGARESGIRNGIIVNGIGSLSSYHLHVVETTKLPPGNIYWKDEAAFDVDLINGYIIDGRVHAHVTVSNETTTYGGHLEPGCRALTFCIITIAEAVTGDLRGLDTYEGQKPRS